MTDHRRAHPRLSATGGVVTARRTVLVGAWEIPVTAFTVGVSVMLHGGLLTAAYFADWSPASRTSAEIEFARGDQATQIDILFEPSPDRVGAVAIREEASRDVPDPEQLAAVPVGAETVEGSKPASEEVAGDEPSDTPVGALDERIEETSSVIDEASERTPEETREDAPPEDVRDTAPGLQAVEAAFDSLVRRFERYLAAHDASDRDAPEPPLVEGTVDHPPEPRTEDAVPSQPSTAQTVGVVTGVEVLDLPTPKYPPLSRRRGEEGVILLQVEVLPSGAVGEITVLQNAGFHRLAEAAIAAARKGRFTPATRDGRPVRDTVRIPFRFVLR